MRRATPPTYSATPVETFLSTLSLRRATLPPSSHVGFAEISIHALLAESDGIAGSASRWKSISIHALLAESDEWALRCNMRRSISIHALLAESDSGGFQESGKSVDFYPRSPCGERRGRRVLSAVDQHFYPRSPCGERRLPPASVSAQSAISIHALLAESDLGFEFEDITEVIFLSTLSLRRATTEAQSLAVTTVISIHALLAESDILGNLDAECVVVISIHALLAESDRQRLRLSAARWYFYPRSPCGERHCGHEFGLGIPAFLSTLSLRRATVPERGRLPLAYDFYPRSPCGERRPC